jgi:WhiB family transcriptional regulator, redox-sensing transcriptional regulator
MDRAACSGMDGNIFYPKVNGEWSPKNEKKARAVCASCPVRVDCIDWACSQRWEELGYWGSEPGQRRKIRKLGDIHSPEGEYIDEFAFDLVALNA